MLKLILLTLLALAPTATWADSGLFYLGAGVTSGSLTDTTISYIPTDLNNTSWKAFAGVRPFKWVAVEADYIDLGSGSKTLHGNSVIDTTHADSSAWVAYAVGFLPIPAPVVDFYGKAGLARWKLNSSLTSYFNIPGFPSNGGSTSEKTGTDFAWGIGAQAHISIAGVRLEYEGFDVNGSIAKVVSLSLFLNL